MPEIDGVVNPRQSLLEHLLIQEQEREKAWFWVDAATFICVAR